MVAHYYKQERSYNRGLKVMFSIKGYPKIREL